MIGLVRFTAFLQRASSARLSYERAVEDEKQAKVKQVLALVLQKEEEAQQQGPVIEKAQEGALKHLELFTEASRAAFMVLENLHQRNDELQAGAELIPL